MTRSVQDRPIVPGANFRGLELSGEDFAGADLSGADFSGASLDGTNFTGAKLVGAKLDRCSARGARFDGADLREASLTRSDLERASLEGAMLQGAQLQGARLSKADLTAANLAEANLWGVDATDANFDGANLAKLDAGGGDFTGSSFRGSLGTSPNFCGARLQFTDFTEADCESARFERADLSGATFLESRVAWADFTAAVLDGATFDRSNLAHSLWTGASTIETRVLECVLEGMDEEIARQFARVVQVIELPGESDEVLAAYGATSRSNTHMSVRRVEWQHFHSSYHDVVVALRSIGDSPLACSLNGIQFRNALCVSIDKERKIFVPTTRGYNHESKRTYVPDEAYLTRGPINTAVFRLLVENVNAIPMGGRDLDGGRVYIVPDGDPVMRFFRKNAKCDVVEILRINVQ
jgi:uncharacterized protein YjbI with pentapeptide repeats